jgi:formylglycine-generating enzyme required for sulfatase activity
MAFAGPLPPLAAASLLATAAVVCAAAWNVRDLDRTEVVRVAAGTMQYRQSGDYLRDGAPIDAPLTAVAFADGLTIMRRQVSQSEYAACVADGACAALRSAGAADTLPMTGVNFDDATAYAAWLSRRTGYRYRPPTDEEWAFAAGERFHDDALSLDRDRRNPAVRWLAVYEAEARAGSGIERRPAAFGSFGSNRNGLSDVAGNVWEWTSGCHSRHSAEADGKTTSVVSCGVRIAEGRHRAQLSDFIREPRSGACSAGAPPLSLGMRLVREEASAAERLMAGFGSLLRLCAGALAI